jgi:hypothetical protein
MYCAKCRAQLPDQANYCFNCGEPVNRAQGQVVANPAAFEILHIDVEQRRNGFYLFGRGDVYRKYRAKIGGRVIYETDWSMNDNALNNMVAGLTAQGWQITGRDRFGRAKQMRRRM